MRMGDGSGCGSTDRADVTGTTAISTNQWHHLGAVFNTTDDVELYIDAVQDSVTYSGTASSISYGSRGFEIGRVQSNGGGSCAESTFIANGQIDDVRIYNRALSPDEIKRLYRLGNPGR
jgi:Concanavalin A-like lectin/glucanases superfamily